MPLRRTGGATADLHTCREHSRSGLRTKDRAGDLDVGETLMHLHHHRSQGTREASGNKEEGKERVKKDLGGMEKETTESRRAQGARTLDTEELSRAGDPGQRQSVNSMNCNVFMPNFAASDKPHSTLLYPSTV